MGVGKLLGPAARAVPGGTRGGGAGLAIPMGQPLSSSVSLIAFSAFSMSPTIVTVPWGS